MLSVTLHQLKIFLAFGRLLNMTHAAKELHMTPAALSIQIKQLAEAVGAPLHEQTGKRLFMTETGHLVEAAARDVLLRLERLETELAEMQGLQRGVLKITIITTAKYFIPRLLGEFCTQYPGIDVALEVANRDQCLLRLSQNMDDLYIMGQVPDHLNAASIPFMKNPLVLIAPAGHPLVGKKAIDPARLAGEMFIMREPGSGTRLTAEQFFESRGINIKVRMTLGSNEAVKQAVAGGLGLAVISRYTLALDEGSGAFSVLDVKGFPLVRQWCAVFPKGKRVSKAAQAFLSRFTPPQGPNALP
ncbi:MAG: LysR substrate-binding domain-containing protein [Deltaproteobacteria bacterium]|nr:LysR substrate-binding domain-containing protein [Deltaproteobacteria bacterium]